MNWTPGMRFCTCSLGWSSPVRARAPCPMPWNPPEKAMTVPLPVAVLQSLIAASTASVPEGEQNCTLALEASSLGMMERRASTNLSLTGVARSRVWSAAPDWIRSIIV